MNPKNKVKIKEMVCLGGFDECNVYPRVIYKRLIMADCSSMIMVHNHPSGDPAPSMADLKLTQIIRDGCKLLDIKFLDHVIIGDTYFSFTEKKV